TMSHMSKIHNHRVISTPAQFVLRRSSNYEHLGRQGAHSVVMNLPIDQHGCAGTVIVNSWVTDDPTRRILPVGRRERYSRLLDGNSPLPCDASKLDDLRRVEEERFDLARELFLSERWDHFFVLF